MKPFVINLSEEDHKALKVRAAKEGISMQELIQAILKDSLKDVVA